MDLLPVVLLSLVLVLVALLSMLYLQLRRACLRIQELEKLNVQKDKLLTVIGHDLSSTVKNTQPAIQLYRSGNLTTAEKNFLLDSMEENALQASVTLDSLLNWGKLQLKGITLNQSYFDAAEVIKIKLKFMETVAKNKNLTIVNNLQHMTVYVDIDQFRFITRNLLSNAIKFSRTGGTVEIAIVEAKQNGFVVIAVKDSGVGMSKQKLEQVFDAFNTSTEGTSKEKGNGIGLMLCKAYAKVNGGDLWAESEDHIGATFYLALKSREHDEQFVFKRFKSNYEISNDTSLPLL